MFFLLHKIHKLHTHYVHNRWCPIKSSTNMQIAARRNKLGYKTLSHCTHGIRNVLTKSKQIVYKRLIEHHHEDIIIITDNKIKFWHIWWSSTSSYLFLVNI